jgi:hypothetical protein
MGTLMPRGLSLHSLLTGCYFIAELYTDIFSITRAAANLIAESMIIESMIAVNPGAVRLKNEKNQSKNLLYIVCI